MKRGCGYPVTCPLAAAAALPAKPYEVSETTLIGQGSSTTLYVWLWKNSRENEYSPPVALIFSRLRQRLHYLGSNLTGQNTALASRHTQAQPCSPSSTANSGPVSSPTPRLGFVHSCPRPMSKPSITSCSGIHHMSRRTEEIVQPLFICCSPKPVRVVFTFFYGWAAAIQSPYHFDMQPTGPKTMDCMRRNTVSVC